MQGLRGAVTGNRREGGRGCFQEWWHLTCDLKNMNLLVVSTREVLQEEGAVCSWLAHGSGSKDKCL